jgi:hypothetical protein
MPLADTLLRLAAGPRLYLPKWTDQVMSEVSRNLIENFGLSESQAAHRESEIRKHFPEPWIFGYEDLIPAMRLEYASSPRPVPAPRRPVVSGNEHDGRHIFSPDCTHNCKSIHLRHLHIEKHNIRIALSNGHDGFASVSGLANRRNFRVPGEQIP